jgi:hypothetical protein
MRFWKAKLDALKNFYETFFNCLELCGTNSVTLVYRIWYLLVKLSCVFNRNFPVQKLKPHSSKSRNRTVKAPLQLWINVAKDRCCNCLFNCEISLHVSPLNVNNVLWKHFYWTKCFAWYKVSFLDMKIIVNVFCLMLCSMVFLLHANTKFFSNLLLKLNFNNTH